MVIEHTHGTGRYTLRGYQHAAIEALFAFLCEKPGNPILALPTGAGKAVVQAGFIRRVLEGWPSERFLCVTHVRELVQQNAAKLRDMVPGVSVGVFSAGLKRRELGYQVTVAGIQSVYKIAHQIGDVSMVLIDECHLVARGGGMYRRFLEDLARFCPSVRVIGLTATPWRLDSGSLVLGKERLFTDVAFSVSIRELIRDGYLSPLVTAKTITRTSVAGVRRLGGRGDYVKGELEAAVNKDDVTGPACDEVLRLAEGRRSLLVFTVGVNHAAAVCAALQARGVAAEVVDGETASRQRDEALEAFRRGQLRALVSVGVLTTGVDLPMVDCIVCLRDTASAGLWCLDSETEVLTSHGWKGPKEIVVGDCALATDLSGRGSWSPVLAKIERPMGANEKWVEYNAPRANFRVTDQHRMIFGTEKNRSWRIGTAAEVAEYKDGVYLPTAVHIEQPGAPLTDAELYLIGIIMTDGSISTHKVEIYQSERHPEILSRIEDSLIAAGLFYRKDRVKSAGSFVERFPRWRFRINAGEPREGRPGRGIRYLYPFLSKDLSPALMSLSRHQFVKLLEGLFDGDGAKKHKLPNLDYTPRSLEICSVRKVTVDRLQALATMHGFTANLRMDKNRRKNALWYLTFTPRDWRKIAGSGDRPQVVISPGTQESVWCVETEAGTIVTRRRGKVTVMGNCQIVGRGLRLSPETGKRDCLVLDFTANSRTHGPVDLIEVADDGSCRACPLTDCEACSADIPRSARTCPACGHTRGTPCPECMAPIPLGGAECAECGFVRPERGERKAKHDTTASTADVLSDGTGTLREIVAEWGFRVHRKAGKPDSVEVEYRVDKLTVYKEWLCFSHGGRAAQKAALWWVRHGGRSPAPDTAANALLRQAEVTMPTEIRVRREGKYWSVAN